MVPRIRLPLLYLLGLASLLSAALAWGRPPQKPGTDRMVIVPESDRFTPFAITIRAGETVQWVNMDTDDHTVVSDDAFNTAGHQGFNELLPGTESNGGQPGKLSLTFHHKGTFVYYCRFHSHLDDNNQPAAPGPDGGIQDASVIQCDPAGPDTCNFGTPMMGVITVLRGNDHDDDRQDDSD